MQKLGLVYTCSSNGDIKLKVKLVEVMGKKKRKGGSKKSGMKDVEPKFTAEDLLTKVEEYIETFDYELALKFCKKAMEMEPGNIKVVETLACVYAESGDMEKSKEYFLKAVEMNSEVGHEKYMYLGQMSGGKEAIKWYLKGIEIMKNELENQNGNSESTSELHAKSSTKKTDISNAFCALSELYMTDCCFEEDAATQCEKYCSEALKYDPKNYEAYIVNANFLLSLERNEEAKNLLKQCFESLNIKPSQAADDEIESEDEEMGETNLAEKTNENGAEYNLPEETGSDELPPYASRVTLAKLLTEVGEHDMSEVILNTLVGDDDEDLEVWYIYGWNCYLQDDFSDAMLYLEKAKEIYEKLACNDEELISHMNEMLEKCKSQTSDANNGMEVEE